MISSSRLVSIAATAVLIETAGCDANSNASAGTTALDPSSASEFLDKEAVEAGAGRVISDNYGLDVAAVLCPDRIPVIAETTATCTATVDGANKSVMLTIVDEDGTYEVSRPE